MAHQYVSERATNTMANNVVSSELHAVQVDFAGLMEVLGKNLYSTPMVALRELVQNAHDSCVRRRLEEGAVGYAPAIRVRPEMSKRRLVIEDNGAGLMRQEIIDYLATVGRGYTRRLRESTGHDDLIGAFGLGFLSAYVISDRVEVETVSYQEPGECWRFSSTSGERFSLEPLEGEERPVGTRVIIWLSKDFEPLSDPFKTRPVLERYCCLLPLPVYLGEEPTALNDAPPPWRLDAEEAASARGQRQKEAFAKRFEPTFDPLCVLDVEPTQGSDIRGLLWVQDGATYGTSDNRNLSVFVRGMLVSREEIDLLPGWAGFVGGVIESQELMPTASRETLMQDAAYGRAQVAVREALIEGLRRTQRQQAAVWRRILRRHNEALLGASICDDRLFGLLADGLTVPTTEGDLRMQEVVDRSRKNGGRKLYVSFHERQGAEEVLFRALQVPIIDGVRYGAWPFAQRWCEQRGVPVVRLGTRGGDAALFPGVDEEDAPEGAVEALEDLLGHRSKASICLTRFEPDYLPLVLVHDQEVKLKRKLEQDEADRRISSAVLGLARLYTEEVDDTVEARLYVNLDAPPIAALLACGDEAQRREAADLLWALATLMAPAGEVGADLEESLRRYNDVLVRRLREHGDEE